MAAAKKTTISENTLDPETQKLIDEALKAEGVDASQVNEYIGLVPIYSPGDAIENSWPPLVGYADRIELLPEQNRGNNDLWTPVMVRFILTQPTKAVAGPKMNRQVVDLKAGDEILLPISGSLGVNSKLEQSAADPTTAHCILVAATGSTPSPKGNAMWNFKVLELPTKNVARKGHPKLAYPLAFKSFGGIPFQDAPAPQGLPQVNGAAAPAPVS